MDKKKKIGILTQPLTTNYGGILQNFALQKVLIRLGHEPITIDYGRLSWIDYMHSWCSYCRAGYKGNRPENPIANKKKQQGFRKFIDAHICVTTPKSRKIDWNLVANMHFDTLIVGSDQVWRPCYNPDITAMFLKPIENNVKKIAYAASFGTDRWEYNEKQTIECRQLIQTFDGVSVRELSGVKLCKDHLDYSATWVLDPTLLLTKEDYVGLCGQINREEPFVFAYILDESEQKMDELQRFAHAKGMSLVVKSAGPQAKESDTIEQWLAYFRDAQFVITDSFHGTVFSILFNKDFFVYGNPERGNSRFTSLLHLFDLQSRLVESIPLHSNTIDWTLVNSIHNEQRERAIDWLLQKLL